MRRILAALVLLLAVTQVNADQMLGRFKVKALFAEPGVAGVYLQEGLPQCLFDLMYMELGTPEGKARLALLTTAKASGWAVTRIDYTRDATSGKCVLFGVHVE